MVALLIRWEMTASLAQLGAGFIQPFAGGPAGHESHEDKPDGFPLSVSTRHFSNLNLNF